VTRRFALLSALACVLGAVCVYAVAFLTGHGVAADNELLQRLQRWPGAPSYEYADAIAQLVNAIPYALMGLVVCCVAGLTHGLRGVLVIAALLVVPSFVTELLKHATAMDRGPIDPASWPSGHTTAATALGAALVLSVPAGWRPLAALVGLALAGGVGLGVVVTGWHYPSDVAGGYLVAATGAFVATACLPKVSRPAATAALPARSLHARG
jgi:membrane-associated phospholipid phosphatase